MGTSSLTRDKSKTENLETQRKRRFLGVVTLAQPFSSPARLLLSSRQYPQKTSASSATSAFQGFSVLTLLNARKTKPPACAPAVFIIWMTLRSRQSLGYVVEDDDRGKQHQKDEGRLIDAFLDLLFDVAPHDAFDQQHEHQSAIENRNREQVEDRQVEADDGQYHEQRNPAFLLPGVPGDLADHNGAADLLEVDLALDHLPDQFKDQDRIGFALVGGARQRIGEGELPDLLQFFAANADDITFLAFNLAHL